MPTSNAGMGKAAIVMVSSVPGSRPWRAGRVFIEKVAKPSSRPTPRSHGMTSAIGSFIPTWIFSIEKRENALSTL